MTSAKIRNHGMRAVLTIENGHPFKCDACGKCYTTVHFSARCCETSCTDLRDGTVTAYSQETEVKAQAVETARWEAELQLARFECSCGERFRKVEHARSCRKCRTYTEQGYCSEVYDRNTESVVRSVQAVEIKVQQVQQDARRKNQQQ